MFISNTNIPVKQANLNAKLDFMKAIEALNH